MLVALPAEARPLRRHFGLLRDNRCTALPLYRRDRLALAISGPGIGPAHGATVAARAWLGPGPRSAWLNIGIAGHRSHPVGSAILAREVRDHRDVRHWIVPPPPAWSGETGLLITVPRPETRYPARALYDMEGVGFFAAAREFAPPQRVQALKIVSDNRAHPPDGLDGRRVSRLIEAQLERVGQLIEALAQTE